MDESHIQEAAESVFQSVGFSAYLHGIDYDLDTFLEELQAASEYIRSQSG